MPKIIALVSSRKMPSIAFCVRTKRKPSARVARLARSVPSGGARRGIATTARIEAPNDTASTM